MSEIMDLIKQNVLGFISNNDEVPADKKDDVVNETTNSILDGFKSNFNLNNISEIKNLFSGNNGAVEDNTITNNVQGNVISSLIQKVGLTKGTSETIASTVVPMVIKAISGKMTGGKFDVSSLLSLISGSKSGSEGDSGILGKLGKLFG